MIQPKAIHDNGPTVSQHFNHKFERETRRISAIGNGRNDGIAGVAAHVHIP
jgi:hypothetical protein